MSNPLLLLQRRITHAFFNEAFEEMSIASQITSNYLRDQ